MNKVEPYEPSQKELLHVSGGTPDKYNELYNLFTQLAKLFKDTRRPASIFFNEAQSILNSTSMLTDDERTKLTLYILTLSREI